jgi:hypothetical protein
LPDSPINAFALCTPCPNKYSILNIKKSCGFQLSLIPR